MAQDPILLRRPYHEVINMQYKKLGDCAEIRFCSLTPSRSKRQTAPSKWFVCANFLADNKGIDNPTVNYVAPDDDWILNKHDIVVKRITPTFVNYIDFEPDEIYCGNNLIIVSPNLSEDGKYLAMFLNEKIGELSKESSIGAVMKSISRNDLESLEVPYPDKKRRQMLGELWYKSIELKKYRIRLAELENIRTNYLIKKSIHNSGGSNHG